MKTIDFISPELYLRNYKFKKHSNTLGGILFILTVLSGASFSIYFFVKLFQKTDPKSYLVEKYLEDAGTINCDSTGILHFIQLLSLDTNNYINYDETIMEYTGQLSFKNGTIFAWYNYGQCSSISIYKNVVPQLFLNTSICIKSQYFPDQNKTIMADDPEFRPPNLSHGMATTSEYATLYHTYLTKCQNTTLNNNKCVSQNLIEKNIKNLIVIFKFSDNYFDVQNYTNPVIQFINSIGTGYATDSYIINSINIKPVQMSTNDGFMFDNARIEYSYKLQTNEKLTTKKLTSDDERIIVRYSLFLQNMAQIYDRSYIKLQDVLANIGGILKLITFLSSCLNYLSFQSQVLKDTFHSFNQVVNIDENLFSECNLDKSKYKTETSKDILKQNVNPVIIHNIKEGRTIVNALGMENLNDNVNVNPDHKNNTKQKFNDVSAFQYFKAILGCKKNRIFEELDNFRNFILNEALLYEMFLDHFRFKKYFKMMANERWGELFNSKLSLDDLSVEYESREYPK